MWLEIFILGSIVSAVLLFVLACEAAETNRVRASKLKGGAKPPKLQDRKHWSYEKRLQHGLIREGAAHPGRGKSAIDEHTATYGAAMGAATIAQSFADTPSGESSDGGYVDLGGFC